MQGKLIEQLIIKSNLKILIVAEAPAGSYNGFGKLLSNLFENWDVQNLLTFFSNSIYEKSHASDQCQFAHIPQSPGRRYALPYLFGIKPEWRGRYSKKWLLRKLKSFKPDAIYSLIHSESTLLFADWISQVLESPHIIHIADLPTTEFDKKIKEVIQSSYQLVTISESMSSFIKKETGKPSKIIYNGLKYHNKNQLWKAKNIQDDIVVRYVGTLLQEQQGESIEDIAEAILQLNKEGIKIRMELYGTETNPQLSKRICDDHIIKHLGKFREDDYVNLLTSCSLLVIPLTFNESRTENYRYSFPAKLPDSLGSGVPVLIYGPPEMDAVKYCKNNRVGHTICERSISKIKKFLKVLLEKPICFKQNAMMSQYHAHEKMSVETNRIEFEECLKIIT